MRLTPFILWGSKWGSVLEDAMIMALFEPPVIFSSIFFPCPGSPSFRPMAPVDRFRLLPCSCHRRRSLYPGTLSSNLAARPGKGAAGGYIAFRCQRYLGRKSSATRGCGGNKILRWRRYGRRGGEPCGYPGSRSRHPWLYTEMLYIIKPDEEDRMIIRSSFKRE
jgi:hypothetical protein